MTKKGPEPPGAAAKRKRKRHALAEIPVDLSRPSFEIDEVIAFIVRALGEAAAANRPQGSDGSDEESVTIEKIEALTRENRTLIEVAEGIRAGEIVAIDRYSLKEVVAFDWSGRRRYVILRDEVKKLCSAYRIRLVEQADNLPAMETVSKDKSPPAGRPLRTSEVAEAFAGLNWDEAGWLRTFKKRVPLWLSECQVERGEPGREPREATWNALHIGIALVSGKPRGQAVEHQEMTRRFHSNRLLKSWQSAWKDYLDTNPALSPDG